MQNLSDEILIIEDDDLFFYALSSRLARKGLKVSRAKDGRDGINKAKRNKFSLIVTDLVLPHYNGFDIIKTLRYDYGLKHKFLVLSNLGNTHLVEDRDFLASLGIVKYLIKSNHSITEVVNNIVECANERHA